MPSTSSTPNNEVSQIRQEIAALQIRVDDLNQALEQIRLAFPLNDLNKEDYDGHRKDHVKSRKLDENIADIKFESAKKVVLGLVTLVIGIFALGATTWILKLVNQ